MKNNDGKKLIGKIIKSGIIDSIGDAISIQDLDFKILYLNGPARDIIGNQTGKYCYKAIEGTDSICENCPLQKSFLDGKTHKDERKNPTRNLYVEITSSPIKDEKGNIIAGIEVVRDITARKKSERYENGIRRKIEKELREAEKDRQNQYKELEETNTALKVLLKQREHDQREFEDNIMSNIKHLVLPYIEKLKENRPSSTEHVLLNILESNLKDIVSPFSSRLSSRYLNFTPREIMIADLIKDGKQDKDIMKTLYVALETVKTHRQNLRKKLGIYGKRINLRTKLLSLE